MLIILMWVLQTYLDPVRFPREQELSDAETECKGKLKQHQDFRGMQKNVSKFLKVCFTIHPYVAKCHSPELVY